jgi:hypothetical protein
MGQTSHGLRWPYGPVALITPFNFPLEIPALQLMGALFMGNKPLVHVDHRVRRAMRLCFGQTVTQSSRVNTPYISLLHISDGGPFHVTLL